MKKSGSIENQICDLQLFLYICSQSRTIPLVAFLSFAYVKLMQHTPRASLQRELFHKYVLPSYMPDVAVERPGVGVEGLQKCQLYVECLMEISGPCFHLSLMKEQVFIFCFQGMYLLYQVIIIQLYKVWNIAFVIDLKFLFAYRN